MITLSGPNVTTVVHIGGIRCIRVRDVMKEAEVSVNVIAVKRPQATKSRWPSQARRSKEMNSPTEPAEGMKPC